MTKAKAIKLYCFDCAGESNKEATLCGAHDCPLWPYRLGSAAGSSAYKSRVQIALENYKDEIWPEDRDFLSASCRKTTAKQASGAKKSPRPISGAGIKKIAARNGLFAKKGE